MAEIMPQAERGVNPKACYNRANLTKRRRVAEGTLEAKWIAARSSLGLRGI